MSSPVWPTRLASISRPNVRSLRWQALGDLAELVGRLRDVLARVFAFGRIEREAADQLGFEGVGQLAGAADFFFQIFLERHEAVLGAVVDVAQLHLADRRADRGDVHAVLVFEVAELGDLALGELHHVLDAVADVDEPQAVVLQAGGGEGGELLGGRLVVGGFVAEAGEDDLGASRTWMSSKRLRFTTETQRSQRR